MSLGAKSWLPISRPSTWVLSTMDWIASMTWCSALTQVQQQQNQRLRTDPLKSWAKMSLSSFVLSVGSQQLQGLLYSLTNGSSTHIAQSYRYFLGLGKYYHCCRRNRCRGKAKQRASAISIIFKEEGRSLSLLLAIRTDRRSNSGGILFKNKSTVLIWPHPQ